MRRGIGVGAACMTAMVAHSVRTVCMTPMVFGSAGILPAHHVLRRTLRMVFWKPASASSYWM